MYFLFLALGVLSMLKVIKRKVLNFFNKCGYKLVNISPNTNSSAWQCTREQQVTCYQMKELTKQVKKKTSSKSTS